MPWISFLLALGCFAIAMKTQSIGLALICLLLALGLMLWGALTLVASRIQGNSQGPMGLNPVLERKRLQDAGVSIATATTTAADASDSDSDSEIDPEAAADESIPFDHDPEPKA